MYNENTAVSFYQASSQGVQQWTKIESAPRVWYIQLHINLSHFRHMSPLEPGQLWLLCVADAEIVFFSLFSTCFVFVLSLKRVTTSKDKSQKMFTNFITSYVTGERTVVSCRYVNIENTQVRTNSKQWSSCTITATSIAGLWETEKPTHTVSWRLSRVQAEGIINTTFSAVTQRVVDMHDTPIKLDSLHRKMMERNRLYQIILLSLSHNGSTHNRGTDQTYAWRETWNTRGRVLSWSMLSWVLWVSTHQSVDHTADDVFIESWKNERNDNVLETRDRDQQVHGLEWGTLYIS